MRHIFFNVLVVNNKSQKRNKKSVEDTCSDFKSENILFTTFFMFMNYTRYIIRSHNYMFENTEKFCSFPRNKFTGHKLNKNKVCFSGFPVTEDFDHGYIIFKSMALDIKSRCNPVFINSFTKFDKIRENFLMKCDRGPNREKSFEKNSPSIVIADL